MKQYGHFNGNAYVITDRNTLRQVSELNIKAVLR